MMIESILKGTTTPLLQQVAAFAERRHEVLAGNIANIDTPDYRFRDLPTAEFRQALEAAIAGRRAFPPSGASFAESLPAPPKFPRTLFQAVESPAAGLTFQDANNRNLEHQTTEMTKNLLLQHFALELMALQMNQLQAVIAEKP